MIKDFESYSQVKSKRVDAAGIAVVLQNGEEPMVLLVHPTGASWQEARMGIPKGKIEHGESIIDAAIRETFEETGILISPSQLEQGIETAEVWKGPKFGYNIHYLVCKIKDLSEIGLTDIRVPKTQLQEKEVDWAGFVKISEAYPRVVNSQRIILDRLR
jgi:predicted NUDIX family NTP pyrophosphohydrolase